MGNGLLLVWRLGRVQNLSQGFNQHRSGRLVQLSRRHVLPHDHAGLPQSLFSWNLRGVHVERGAVVHRLSSGLLQHWDGDAYLQCVCELSGGKVLCSVCRRDVRRLSSRHLLWHNRCLPELSLHPVSCRHLLDRSGGDRRADLYRLSGGDLFWHSWIVVCHQLSELPGWHVLWRDRPNSFN